MNIIIVGCGKVGQALAEQLNEEGNNITVIDLNPKKVNSVSARLDIMGVVGNGATHMTQQEAGIKHADLLIAVTASDELNLLCCLIAKKAGNCQTILIFLFRILYRSLILYFVLRYMKRSRLLQLQKKTSGMSG